MASRMSWEARSVGRLRASPSWTRRREVQASVRAWTWRWFVTNVVSLSARRSRCDEARIERKLSIPEPVFAEIPMIGVKSDASAAFSTNEALISLLLSEETIKFTMLTFLLTSQMSVLLSKKTSF